MFESVNRLQSGGILDDFEVHVIHDQINVLVKDLTTIPVVMKTVPTENLFLNITWVNGDRELGKFLLENSVLCDFDLGDVVVQDDEEPDSIFLVLTGLVKIVYGEYRGEENESTSMEDLTGSFMPKNRRTLYDIFDKVTMRMMTIAIFIVTMLQLVPLLVSLAVLLVNQLVSQ